MKLRDLFEAEGKTAVVAFGRMNPPTIGHAKLVDRIKSIQGDHYVFLSQSQKPKTDPLPFADKLRYAKFFFPEITIGNPEVRTPIQMMQYLEGLGYTDIIYVAGSDRAPAFDKLFNDYNGKDYTFNSIEVVSAGERDPDADGAEGMSASKMRAAAAEGDLESFKQGVPQQEVADEMFSAVRQGMGIRDEEPVAAESSIASKINWGGQHDDDEEKNNKKKKKQSFFNKLKSAMGLDEKAPPGREDQVKALKKEFPDDEGAPYAIAWAQHNKKKKKTNESDVVIDPIQLRSYLRMLIDDAIDKEQDIDKLSKVLKILVGKEIKNRGKRYQITSEDVITAFEASCKNRKKKMNENADQMLKDFARHYSEYVIRRDQADPDAAMVPTLRQANNKMKQIIATHLNKANQLEKKLTQMGHGDKVQQVKANMKPTPADPSTFDKDI